MSRIGSIRVPVRVTVEPIAVVRRDVAAVVRVGGREIEVSEPVGPEDLSRIGSALIACTCIYKES